MAPLGSVCNGLRQLGVGYSQTREEVAVVPPGLDWVGWQVDAAKNPFKPGYTSFRAWWEYGSGLVGDSRERCDAQATTRTLVLKPLLVSCCTWGSLPWAVTGLWQASCVRAC